MHYEAHITTKYLCCENLQVISIQYMQLCTKINAKHISAYFQHILSIYSDRLYYDIFSYIKYI